ncbi:MAG: anthranilate phosphoribosyltransferase [Planctomycetaceae bacterium]
MNDLLRSPMSRLLRQESLSQEEVRVVVGAMMDGQCDPVEIAAFLTALAIKTPQPAELAGAACAMRERATPLRPKVRPLIDTCGTGGDQLHTFNISTATAIVVAACGVPVAKHGNRSVSSKSGSADVLEALGVNISLSAEQATECLDAIGLCFCFAPLIHGAMKHAAPVRKQLGFPTIFNLLGPLTNPASAEFQLIGTSSEARAELLARTIALLGTVRTLVVCGASQLDEVSLWGRTRVFDVTGSRVQTTEWSASDFGLPECLADDLRIASSEESADVIRSVFAGTTGAALNMVLANSAAALLAAGKCKTLREGVDRSKETVISGAASSMLDLLIRTTQAMK